MRYVGKGNSLPNIPARDLTDEEVKKYGRRILLQSGLYEEVKPKYKPKDEYIKE